VLVRSADDLELRGTLQEQVMRIVWELGKATVDDVRAEQPRRRRPAYTTVQTVLNRLVDRGLLVRERRGRAFVYRPAYNESEVVAHAIGARLADASHEARRAALLNLVEGLDPDELDDVARLANRIRRERRKG
jgi:predicted transcriptional regulator